MSVVPVSRLPRRSRMWFAPIPDAATAGDADPVVPSLLPDYHENSPVEAAVLGAFAYCAALLFFLILIPAGLPAAAASTAVVTVGVIGIWRWSWGGIHLVRALIYKRLRFPSIRRRAAMAGRPPSLYVVITSYRMAQEINAAVYGRLFGEIAAYGVPTFIVACITDPADARVIGKSFYRSTALPEGTTLQFCSQAGTGKRAAMAEALEAIARLRPPPTAHVILMDGDTLLGNGSLEKTCSVLMARPDVGAVTTDNIPLVKGHALTREWYRVRMSHRDNLMASLSLSNKVLVLTGRFSVFRAEVATTPDFMLAVERDAVDHWRLGRLRMVTGDDKSTWYNVLRRGWNMLYVPDAVVYPIEELPQASFVKSTTSLMTRWYGNMARNNMRALRLGPARCGWFTWTSLLDQRLSMWTSLVGPTTMVALSILHHRNYIPYYIAWVLLTRGLISLCYFVVSGRFHPLFPLVLYYNQIVGAALKIYMIFHQDKQKWTRQEVAVVGGRRVSRLYALSSDIYMSLCVGLFVLGIAVLAGVLEIGHIKVPVAGYSGLVH